MDATLIGDDAGKEIQRQVERAITDQLVILRPTRKIALSYISPPEKDEINTNYFIKMLCFDNPPLCVHVMIIKNDDKPRYKGRVQEYKSVGDPISTKVADYKF